MIDASHVWIIIPVYNEAPVIEVVVQEVRKTFPNVVCVDDGSRDGSALRIRATGAHLIRHPINLGQGASIQTGVEYARVQRGARYFVTFDADGQHQVSDVLAMLEQLQHGSVDIVVGTRFHGDISHIPVLKRLILKTAVFMSVRNRKLHLTDAHNGLRTFNRTVADQIDIKRGGMSHASEIVEMIDRYHWRVAEIPVTILYTDYSRSKGQSVVNGVNILFENALSIGSRR